MKKALKRVVREEIIREILFTTAIIVGVFTILYLTDLLHFE